MNKLLTGSVACIALLVLITRAANGDWEPSNGPNGGLVEKVAVKGTTVFASSGISGISRSTDGGETWALIRAGKILKSPRVLAINDSTVFVGTDSALLRSMDNGTTWTAVFDESIDALGANGSTVILQAGSHDVYLSTDNGTTWTEIDNVDLPYRIHSFAFCHNTILTGSGNYIYRSTDSGATWATTELEISFLTQFTFSVRGDKIFANAGVNIFLSIDTGKSWTPTNDSGFSDSINHIAVSGNTLFAVGNWLYRSTDDGKNWERIDSFQPGEVYSLAVSGYTVFVGTDEGVFRSTDNGTHWHSANSGLSHIRISCLAVNGSTIATGMADIVRGCGIYISSDNGAGWTIVDSCFRAPSIFSLAFCGATMVAAASGGVFRSDDNGKTWSKSTFDIRPSGISLLAVYGDSLFATGTSSGVYLSTDKAISWTQIDTGLSNVPKTSLAANDGTVYASVTSRAVVRYRAENGGWLPCTTGLDRITGYSVAADKQTVIVGGFKGIYYFVDDTKWEKADSAFSFARHFSIYDSVIIGVAGDDVIFSSDYGKNWSPVTGNFGTTAVQATVIANNTVFIGTDGNGVWRQTIKELLGESETVVQKKRKLCKQFTIKRDGSRMIVTLTLLKREAVKVELFDLNGKKIASLAGRYLSRGRHTLSITTNKLPHGCYVVKIQTGNSNSVKLLQVIH